MQMPQISTLIADAIGSVGNELEPGGVPPRQI